MGSARKVWQSRKGAAKADWEGLEKTHRVKDGFGPALDEAESAVESAGSAAKQYLADAQKLKALLTKLERVHEEYSRVAKRQSGRDRKILAEGLSSAIAALSRRMETELNNADRICALSALSNRALDGADNFIR